MDLKDKSILSNFLEETFNKKRLERHINTLFKTDRSLLTYWKRNVETYRGYNIDEISFDFTKGGVKDKSIEEIINPVIRFTTDDNLYFVIGGELGDFKKFLDVSEGYSEGVLSGENLELEKIFSKNKSVVVLFSLSRLIREAQSKLITEQAHQCYERQQLLMDKITQYNETHLFFQILTILIKYLLLRLKNDAAKPNSPLANARFGAIALGQQLKTPRSEYRLFFVKHFLESDFPP